METQYPNTPIRQHRPYIHGGGGGSGGAGGGGGGGVGPSPIIDMTKQSMHSQSDNDRSRSELRAVDCNLTSLCDHIQLEGFNNGAFSDVIVHVMGSTYHLHRLILSRSSYFRSLFLISRFS